jgi:cell wall-associated NlpC family hydrolase
MFAYAESLLGVPYHWWKEGEACLGGAAPFYAATGPPPSAPTTLNCAGFINCLARFAGRPIPGVAEALWYAGGTYAWYEELAPKCISIDATTAARPGTLLIRRFRDEADQGHLGVVWTDGLIIHCWPDRGVVIEPAPPNYFEYICEDWLSEKLNLRPSL